MKERDQGRKVRSREGDGESQVLMGSECRLRGAYPSSSLPPAHPPVPPTPADPFALKLVGGRSHCEGRLEVLHKGEWGSVCDDGWGQDADRVVCRQLGCGQPLSPPVKVRRRFGPGVGRIWLDDVKCSGKEPSLEQCLHRSWGYHNCNHREDVAVVCEGQSWVDGPAWREGRTGGAPSGGETPAATPLPHFTLSSRDTSEAFQP